MASFRTAHVLLLGSALLTVPTIDAAAAVRWEHLPGVRHSGALGLLAGDLDGDGRAEVVFSTHTSGNRVALAVVAQGEDGIGLQQLLPVSEGFVSRIAIGEVDGRARVLLAMEDEGGSTMVEYGGLPLRELRRLTTGDYVRPLAIADIDGDGTQELLAQRASFPYVENPVAILDYATGDTRWIDTQFTREAILAQLDTDPALEIIIPGLPGRVIDGATRLPEWSYPAGFESALFSGAFDPAHPTDDFAAISLEYGGTLTLFGSSPYSPLREVDTGFGRSGGAVVDLDADGFDEIVLPGGSLEGGVAIYTPALDALRRVIMPDLQAGHVSAADVTGDATPELIVLTTQSHASPDGMRLIDPETEATLASVQQADGPYAALALLDRDADGQDEVIHALFQRDEDPSQRRVLCVLDARSGRRERCLVDTYPVSSPGVVAPVAGRFNTAAGTDVVFPNEERISAFDGATLQPMWERRLLENGYSRVDAAVAMRFDADDIDDVVVLDWTARLHVLDGRNGNTLWQSVTLGAELLNSEKTVTIANIDADPASEILVTVGNTLYAFDAQTRLLQWSLVTPLEVGRFLTWGSADACRLGLYDPDGRLQTYRCDDRTQVGGDRMLPENANLLRVLDAEGETLLVASAGRVLTVDADDHVREWARDLGAELGNNNAGAVIPLGGDRYDVILGSDRAVTRLGIHIDLVFSDAFE